MILRTTAFFFGVFGLVNFFLGLVVAGFDANLWWIDFRILEILSSGLPTVALLVTTSSLLLFAGRGPRIPRGLVDWATWGALWFLCALIFQNIIQYYLLLSAGMIRSALPVPLSLLLLIPIVAIARANTRPVHSFGSGRAGGRWLDNLRILTVLGGLSVLFPLAQMICFGGTDYRRPADIIVVFGARAYTSGRMSTALFDRTRTAVDLYESGLASRLFFSGGPGDGDIHEVEAMRNYAVDRGVDPRDIMLDRDGLSTQATVDNSLKVFRRIDYTRVMAVSQFYHLPRIKLTYLREGFEVYTVPARKSRLIRKLPLLMVREVAAFWFYYLRPLTQIGILPN